MGRYLMCLALPYVIMVTGFSVLSYFMPVRDGITELSLSQICEKIFVTSIGPYWFIQTMIICGILYYVSFKGATWGTLRQGKTTMSTTTSLFIFATLLLLLSKTPALSPSAATYYFIGAVLRQCHIGFDKIFRPSPVALLLWSNLLGLEEWYDWGTLAIVFSCWCCISSLMWIYSLIKRLQDNANVRKTEDTLLYIGRNTLPIYLFHPIFTMAAKFYHPLFSWDRSEICFALVTIFIAIAGSIGIAKMMEKTHLAYLFGKGKMLR